MDCSRKTFNEKTAQSQGETDQIESTQIRWFSGHPDGKLDLRFKLAQGEPPGLSPLRSVGFHDGQMGGWTALTVAKGLTGRVKKQL